MADKPFDKEIVNVRERPSSSDILRGWGYNEYLIRELIRDLDKYATAFSSQGVALDSPGGFRGTGFRVEPTNPTTMSVTVKSGFGFQFISSDITSSVGGISGLDDLSPYKPLFLSADQTFTIPPASVLFPRIDIIEVKFDQFFTDSTNKDVLDPATGKFVSSNVFKTLSRDLLGRVSTSSGAGTTAMHYKTGTPVSVSSGGPTAPDVTPGYVKIAEIYVSANATSVGGEFISDYRQLLFPHGRFTVCGKFTFDSSGALIGLGNVSAPPGIQVMMPAGTTSNTPSMVVSNVHDSTHLGFAHASYGPAAIFTSDRQANAYFAVSGFDVDYATSTSTLLVTSSDNKPSSFIVSGETPMMRITARAKKTFQASAGNFAVDDMQSGSGDFSHIITITATFQRK